LIDVPTMRFIMVDGKGNPNTGAEYTAAVEMLYGLSYTIKISKKGAATPKGYFDYVVPPLEGLWSVDDGGAFTGNGAMIEDKDLLVWTSMIRRPDFVTPDVFGWAVETLAAKKPNLDLSRARLEEFTEGLCAQILHIGPYDDEPATVATLERFITESGHRTHMSDTRKHHEIYLGGPRKTAPDKLKTIIRHPIIEGTHEEAGQ
jgi:hypothetical protein